MFNVLTVKVRRAVRLSERAIAKFQTTEKALERQNAEIDAVMADLDEQAAYINDLYQAAKARKRENAGIIERIGRIIRG